MIRRRADQEPAAAIKTAVGDNDVKMGIEVLKIAECVHGHCRPGPGVITARGFDQAKAQHFPCAAAELAQQPAVGHEEFGFAEMVDVLLS